MLETGVFDHMLYCQPDAEGLALQGWTESFGPAAPYVRVKVAKEIVDGSRHLYRHAVKGRRANRDIYVLKA